MRFRSFCVVVCVLGIAGVGAGVGCGGGGGGGGSDPGTPPTSTGKPWTGNLITSDTLNVAYRVTLDTGQMTEMPVPDGLGPVQAYWAGYAGGKLLALHQTTKAYFYDTVTLQKAAPDFRISTPLASMYGAKISRDGAYFAACWDGAGSESIGLFRVGGDYVAKIASTSGGRGNCFRFDWLSDQRLIYDSGVDVVVTNGTSSQDIHYPYPKLPDGWKITGTLFSVDPAERRILWSVLLPQPDETSNAIFQVLFVANIDGTSPRQITDHPESAKNSSTPTPAWHSNATWSPDGRFIAYNITTPVVAYYPVPGGNEWVGLCTPVVFVPDDADKVIVDLYGTAVPESLLYTVPSTGKHLRTCAPLIWTQ
jgi:hypothetical protein